MHSFPNDPENPLAAELAESREALDVARKAQAAVDTRIQQIENEIQTASAIAEREITNLEQQVKDAEGLERWNEVRALQAQAAERRNKHAQQINKLESELGRLRNERIELEAARAEHAARLETLKEVADEYRQGDAVSDEQLQRANELEQKLTRLEAERNELAHRIEEYAPVVEAQREVASASGTAELSKAYAEQADDYRAEWQRWLKWLCVAASVALVAGVVVILLAHPSDDASNGTVASRIAIEILVLGLLVYAVRVTAHQFRVHRHLEAVCRGKASA
jgi:chromosome segregation ATPase